MCSTVQMNSVAYVFERKLQMRHEIVPEIVMPYWIAPLHLAKEARIVEFSLFLQASPELN